MNKLYLNRIFTLLILTLFLGGCSDVWDEHTDMNEDVLAVSLSGYLQDDGQFSQFAQLLEETGVIDTLAAASQFTVFAPSNAAMENVPSNQLEDEAAKKRFVLHHITDGRVFNKPEVSGDTLTMLSTKKLVVGNEPFSIDKVEIQNWHKIVRNGIVHQLDAPVLPRKTIWEYIEQDAESNKHIDYLKSLTKLVFDEEASQQIGFNENGEPIYDSVFVYSNEFNQEIADLTSEDSVYTFFIVEDQVLETAYEQFAPYYRVGDGTTPADTAYAMNKITKDFVIGRAYPSKDDIPANPESIFDVKLGYSPGAVIGSFQASNGFIYKLSSCPVELNDRIKTLIIEGENPDSYYGNEEFPELEEAVGEGYLRKREKASQGLDFVVDNHQAGSGPPLTAGLILPVGELPSITYEVYWRAINDFNTSYRYPNDNVLVQHLYAAIPQGKRNSMGRYGAFSTGRHIGDSIAVTATEYMAMAPEGDALLSEPLEDEVYLGTYENFSVSELYLQLLPDGETTRNMAVTVDYIRMVPVFDN